MRADAIYRARFTTFDPERPTATAIAVIGERIVAFDDEADGLDSDVREDFGDAAAFPGFHDAHAHTVSFGRSLEEIDCSSPPMRGLDDVYRAVAVRASTLDRAEVRGPSGGGPGGGDGSGGGGGEWIIGCGYDQNKLGGRHPDRARLDAAGGGRPVWLKHTSGHLCVVSSAALAAIGDRLDAAIEGGAVQRDASGRPTGLLEERAQLLVQQLVQPRPLAELASAIGRAHDRYLEEGITSVCDAGIAGGWIGQSGGELGAYLTAREGGRLRVRTTVMIASDALHGLELHAADGFSDGLDAGIRTGIGDEWLRIGALKVFADGSLIGRTCWMYEPFEDDPLNAGYPQADPDSIRKTIIDAHAGGWQVATHAIGDAAIGLVLDAYEEALSRSPRRDHRHRIEHCAVASDGAVERIAALGVVPVPQGRFVGEIGDGMVAALGEVRAATAYRLRSFIDAGIPLPGSSDRPVVDGRPVLGIADMVSRRTESGRELGRKEALTAEQALWCYTAGSAYATFSEHERGSLARGKLADITVLDRDPRALAPNEIASCRVLATVVGGVLAHDAR